MRILSRRNFLRMAAVAAGTAALAACGATPAPAATSAPAGDATAAPTVEAVATTAPAGTTGEAITLRYRTWHTSEASPKDKAWYDWLTENYPTDHAGAKLEYEFVPFGAEYIQKVLADSAAATAPDLLHSSIVWARDFYDRGVLLDLNDYVDKVPELAPDQFLGDATNAYRSKDGKYYGMPWEGPDSGCIGINSNLAKEAGLDPQGKDIKTWADFVDAAKALTKMEGDEMVQAGFLVDGMRYIESYGSWLYSNGGALSDEGFTKATFNDQKGAEVLQLQLDLLNTHKVSFPISPERQDQQLFMQGKVGMAYAGTWSPASFEGNAPEGFEYWLIPYPQGPSGTSQAVTTWSNMFTLPKKTKNPDAAFELMRYCTTPPVVITRFELSTRTTPHKAIFESESWKKLLVEQPVLAVKPEVAKLGGTYPFFPMFTEANDALGTELEQVILGQKGVEEGLTEGEKKVNEVIARRASAG